jgi:hypothetical protein
MNLPGAERAVVDLRTIGMRRLMNELEELSVVALIEDLPDKELKRGHVGTIVGVLAPGVYEVEFSDDQGRMYASAALHRDQLMRLYHEPIHHAA